MFADLSPKKISIMSLIAAFLLGGATFAYIRYGAYLEGFSSSYYAESLNNFFRARTYIAEYLGRNSGDALASAFQAVYLNETDKKEEEPTQSIPVLLYHGIIDDEAGENEKRDIYSVTRNQFKEHLFALKRAGFQTVGTEDFQLFLEGKKKLPKKTFMLTFDDGRKDSFYGADAVLHALGYQAVMFAITGKSIGRKSLDSTYYLSEWELARIQSSGRWIIESHGREAHSLIPIDKNGAEGYFYGNKMWRADLERLETDLEFRERVKNDLTDSKKEIEETLDIPVTALAFPFGEFGDESANFPDAKNILLRLAAEIYPISFYQFRTDYRYTSNYPLPPENKEHGARFLKRIEVKSDWSADDVLASIRRGEARTLPFSDIGLSDHAWITTWGDVSAGKTEGVMAAPPEDTGAAVILDGSRLWSDYMFRANVFWESGSNVYLWARFQDDGDFVACNFSRERTHIDQRIGGEERVIRGAEEPLAISDESIEFAVRVIGRKVECLADGRILVASDFLEEPLDSGGIGIKIWDEDLGESKIRVKEIGVETAYEIFDNI
ncbi:polysaccharide deacetylase family protein [bacterium]|nr:polysaccharide deacetylase family protein [bacterium]